MKAFFTLLAVSLTVIVPAFAQEQPVYIGGVCGGLVTGSDYIKREEASFLIRLYIAPLTTCLCSLRCWGTLRL
jgi:hypothetical protein